MKDIYAVLDIGSTTIKLLVAETVSANINILFSQKISSHGIKKGKIVHMEDVVKDIQSLIREGSESLGAPITKVALCLPSLEAHLYQGEGITKVSSPEDKITKDDIIRALRLSRKLPIEHDDEVVSVIPVQYYLDTKSMSEMPLGYKSASLKVETLVITSKKTILYSYLTAVEKAGLELLEVTIDAYASAKEAFDAVYLQEGAVLIDIGYKSSTIAFFEDGYLKYLTQAPVGGYDLTRSVALSWQIVMDKAELYKVKYGTCDTDIGDEDIIHTTRVDSQERNYTQKDLSFVLQDAVRELMTQIKTKLEVINDGRNYEIIIVGGGGELPHLDKIAAEVLNAPVRCYRPETIGARDMAYVSTLGMMYYMNDRKNINGRDVSMILPDISNTMSVRFKGLTKAKTLTTNEGNTGKFKKMIESFFEED